MKIILTPDAPKPAGHYSQAVIHDNLVYISGQLPLHPDSGPSRPDTIEAQTEQVLKNIAAILTAAGSRPDKVLKTTVYISDISLWEKVNIVYSLFFGDHRPARVVVPTPELHYGYMIEMDAIACID